MTKTSNDQSTHIWETHLIFRIRSLDSSIRYMHTWNLQATSTHVLMLWVAFAYKFQVCIFLTDGSSDPIWSMQCVSDKIYLCWLVFWCFSQTFITFLSLFPNFVERYMVSSVIILLAEWHDTLLQSYSDFVLPKCICILLKITFLASYVYKVVFIFL